MTNTLRHGDVTRAMGLISERGDWRRVRALYEQLAHSLREHGLRVQDVVELHTELAEALARTFANYEGLEDVFVQDLELLLSAIEGLESLTPAERFRFLYKDTRLNALEVYAPDSDGRRRPKLFEAAVETVRRIVDLNRVHDSLAGLPTTAILGGSLSYGRFYNTCGGQEKPSDIDLLLVLPDHALLPDVATRLARLEFVDRGSGQKMMSRIEPFLALNGGSGSHSVFQHKLRLWDDRPSRYLLDYQVPAGHYNLALHIITHEAFLFLVLRDQPLLEEQGAELFERHLLEFRDDAPEGDVEEHLGFSGQRHRAPLICNEVAGGYVAKRLGCAIIGGRFYPGVHLNLILPRFEVRWEAASMRVRLTLLALRWKLLARLEDERLSFGGRQRLSLSHTRHAVFSPHVLKRLDME